MTDTEQGDVEKVALVTRMIHECLGFNILTDDLVRVSRLSREIIAALKASSPDPAANPDPDLYPETGQRGALNMALRREFGIITTGGRLDRILAALRASPPEGWAVMPVEPTPEIMLAGWNVSPGEDRLARRRYAAMLSASPVKASAPLQGDQLAKLREAATGDALEARVLSPSEGDLGLLGPKEAPHAAAEGECEPAGDALKRELEAHLWEAMANSYDVLGETLRAWAFVGEKDELGCYGTFDLREGFERVEPSPGLLEAMYGRPFDPDFDSDEMQYFSAHRHPLGVTVAWHWDGDGHLYFDADGLGAVTNTDCKCTYGWDEAGRCPPLTLAVSRHPVAADGEAISEGDVATEHNTPPNIPTAEKGAPSPSVFP